MKNLSFHILVLAVAGCTQSGSTDFAKPLNDLNAGTADKVAKAKEPADVNEALMAYSAKRREVLGKIQARVQALPPEKQEAAGKKFVADTKDSHVKLREALDKHTEQYAKAPANPVVLMETSKGDIKIALYEKLAPITVKNFLKYVDDGHYDGTIFHRVIPDFMIQGGGFLPGMRSEKPTREPIVNESYNGVANVKGTLAMARTDQANSATSQFFINVKDNGFLDRLDAADTVGYAVFGKVIDGMDVVEQIRKVETGQRGPHGDVPQADVLIKTVKRVDKK